jgi:hypothetical protein
MVAFMKGHPRWRKHSLLDLPLFLASTVIYDRLKAQDPYNHAHFSSNKAARGYF